MITVINGTNRKNNKTDLFARKFYDLLSSNTAEEVHYLALEEIPHDWFFNNMYDKHQQAKSLGKLQDEHILAADKFLIVSPEYNGGMPGVLKLFIDAVSIRNYSTNFKGKKAALAGVASGRAGNLRGLDQLSDVLNHMGTVVLPNRLPISSIKEVVDEQGKINPATLEAMEKQVKELIEF